MTGPDLLVPAIIVFVLVVLGLGLTFREFSQIEKRGNADPGR